jgi:hypothetical protein
MNEFERKMKERAAKFNQNSTTISTTATTKPTAPIAPNSSIQSKPVADAHIDDTMTAKQKYEYMLQQNKAKESHPIPLPITHTLSQPPMQPQPITKPNQPPLIVQPKPTIVQPTVQSQPNKISAVQSSPIKPVTQVEETKKLDTEKLKDIYKNLPLFATKSSQKAPLHNDAAITLASTSQEGVKLFRPNSNKKTKQFKFDTEDKVVEGFNHLQISTALIEPQIQQQDNNVQIEPPQNVIEPLLATHENNQNIMEKPEIDAPLMEVQANTLNLKERKLVSDAFDDDDDINAKPEIDRIVLDEHELEEQKEGMLFIESGLKTEEKTLTVPKFGVEPKKVTPKLDPLSMMKLVKEKDEMIEL